MLKKLIQLLKSLNSNSHPGEIAHSFCFALLLGFLPKNNIFWYLITVFVLFMRINKLILVLMTFVFALLAPSLDMLFDQAGYWFLTLDYLEPFFASLLEIPFFAYTKFNNSIVMGSLIISLIFYLPLYLFARFLVWLLRSKLIPVLRKTKIIQVLAKLKFIKKIAELADSK